MGPLMLSIERPHEPFPSALPQACVQVLSHWSFGQGEAHAA